MLTHALQPGLILDTAMANCLHLLISLRGNHQLWMRLVRNKTKMDWTPLGSLSRRVSNEFTWVVATID